MKKFSKEESFGAKYPKLAKEWHPTKNNELTPFDFLSSSTKKVWWLLPYDDPITGKHFDFEWQTSIKSRLSGCGCPYLSNRKIFFGFNDLETRNPKLASEWHPIKNGQLKPNMVTYRSDRKIWWQCKKGHEWEANLYSRHKGSGCPICIKSKHTSFMEYAIYYFLKKHDDSIIHSYHDLGFELDIFLPKHNIAIEYDGYYFHKNREKRDILKNKKCKDNNIILYRIREELPSLNDTSIDIISNGKDLNQIIENLIFQLFNIEETIHIEEHSIEIENLRDLMDKENSLAIISPKIAKQWHPTKNGKLTPSMFSYSSSKKMWWQCEKKHEWFDSISHRQQGRNCPYCSNQKLLIGYNDLATTNPQLAKEWHPTKNGTLTSSSVIAGSSKKAWWRCEKGHEWESKINHRNRGVGCPFCSGLYPIQGETDLATTHPDLAKEWHPTKNQELKPTMISFGSEQKVWWQCENEHEWLAMVASRAKGRKTCPYCKDKPRPTKSNNLQITHPEIAKEWNYKKNGKLTPYNVTSGSHKKVWWICEKKHEWQTKIANRPLDNGCPYCNGKNAIEGETDLQTLNPQIAKEWHPTKNDDLTPSMFTPNSYKKIWWKCEKNHEWQTRIVYRSRGMNCPCCSNRKLLKGYNDLETLNPTLAREWHPTKNGNLKPSDVVYGSSKKVWWLCEKGHEWESKVEIRKNGSTCPHCQNELKMEKEKKKEKKKEEKEKKNEENILATKHPQLIKQWHPSKNGTLTPYNVTCGSNREIWWICERGHEWQAPPARRVKGVGCPYCSGRYAIQGETDLATINPQLASEWHPTRNKDLLPTMVAHCSDKKVWWKCDKGHEWQSKVSNRSHGKGCPYCKNHYSIREKNKD